MMIEYKELEMILAILIVLIVPTILGKITNLIFKIKNRSFSDTWYTGIWSSFIVMVALLY